MPRMQNPITFFALFSCLVVFVLTGCIDSGDPVGVEPNGVALNPNQVAEPCPTWEEACDEISSTIRWECPSEGGWKNYGQFKSCRKGMVSTLLKGVEDCFTEEELADLRECALSRSLDTPVIWGGNSRIKTRTN